MSHLALRTPRAYLAGPISGLSYDGAMNWRESLERDLFDCGVEALSPMRGKTYLVGESKIADQYRDRILSTGKAITTRDRNDCTRSDLVIANLLYAERVSIGTVMELAWADAARVPIIVVMEKGGVHDHAMVHEVAGWVVESLEDALLVARAVLNR